MGGAVVQGSRSWYLQLPDLDARIEAIPHRRDRIELEAGHSLHVDCPEQLAAVIIEAASGD